MKVRESVVAQFEYHRQRRLQTITQVAGANSKPGTRNFETVLTVSSRPANQPVSKRRNHLVARLRFGFPCLHNVHRTGGRVFVWSRTVGNDCLIAWQLTTAIRNLCKRNQLGAADVALIKGRLIANIDDHCAAGDQVLRFLLH